MGYATIEAELWARHVGEFLAGNATLRLWLYERLQRSPLYRAAFALFTQGAPPEEVEAMLLRALADNM